jgi:hypothetical protein
MSSSYAGGCLDRFVYWPVAIALASPDDQAPACVAIFCFCMTARATPEDFLIKEDE